MTKKNNCFQFIVFKQQQNILNWELRIPLWCFTCSVFSTKIRIQPSLYCLYCRMLMHSVQLESCRILPIPSLHVNVMLTYNGYEIWCKNETEISGSGYHDMIKCGVAAIPTWSWRFLLSLMRFLGWMYRKCVTFPFTDLLSLFSPLKEKKMSPLFLSDAKTSAPAWPNLSCEGVSGRKWSIEPPLQTASHEVTHSPGTATQHHPSPDIPFSFISHSVYNRYFQVDG